METQLNISMGEIKDIEILIVDLFNEMHTLYTLLHLFCTHWIEFLGSSDRHQTLNNLSTIGTQNRAFK